MALDRQSAETEYLDILRVYACIAVIIYHIFSIVLSLPDIYMSKSEKHICIIIYNIWFWHIPTFLMISGVLFLNNDKELSLKKLYKKYILCIVLVLIIFGIPFAFMELLFNAHYQFSAGQIGTSLLNVFRGKLWEHVWYLYMLIGLYIILPLLKIFIDNADRKNVGICYGHIVYFTSVIPKKTRMPPSIVQRAATQFVFRNQRVRFSVHPG